MTTGSAAPLGIDAQQRQIEPRVGEHQLGRKFAPVGKRDEDLVGAVDDMVVGDDQAVGGNDDAAAQRLLHARLRRGAAEMLADVIVHHRRAAAVDAGGVDVDDGGRGGS